MRLRLLLVSASLLAAGACAAPPPWHVASAPYRIRIEKNKDSPWPANVGYAAVCPGAAGAVGLKISVWSESGAAVGCQILWAADGEPVKILFDTSSKAEAYYVYPGEASAAAWQPEAGVILETRTRTEGPVESAKEIQNLCKISAPVLGRSVVPFINYGIHLHGTNADFVSSYRGYFNAPQAGEYRFATVSSGASVLNVDGRAVAEWPGWHTAEGGTRGEHSGKIALTAGRHLIEYFHVQKADICAAMAAWQPPGQKLLEIMPATAFLPVAGFRAAGFEKSPQGPDQVYFDWELTGHSMVDTWALVDAQFRVLPEEKDVQYRWSFDDNTSTNGAAVSHLFPKPGLRIVKLVATRKNGSAVALGQKVLVHPVWSQVMEWDDARFDRQKADLAVRDPLAMPMADLIHLAGLAFRVDERPWLTRLGAACFSRQKELIPDYADIFFDLGLHYQHPEVNDMAMAERAFRQALDLKPPDPKLQDKIRLHFAGFLIHSAMKTDAAMALLNAVKDDNLADVDKRLKPIYLADVLFFSGRAAAAREAYLAIGDTVDLKNVQNVIRRRAQTETARDALSRQEYDVAETVIRTIEWESPSARMSNETGLMLVRLWLDQKQYPFALSRCRALLNVDSRDRDRADVLYALIEIYDAIGFRKEAEQTLTQLLKDHPYSEAAARATDRWGKPGKNGKK